MEINTSLSRYGRGTLAYENLRQTDVVQEMDSAPVKRRDNALTGSSTVLSASLASALWAVQEKNDPSYKDASSDRPSPNRVESRYFEFGD